jgi:hypothetical protein
VKSVPATVPALVLSAGLPVGVDRVGVRLGFGVQTSCWVLRKQALLVGGCLFGTCRSCGGTASGVGVGRCGWVDVVVV